MNGLLNSKDQSIYLHYESTNTNTLNEYTFPHPVKFLREMGTSNFQYYMEDDLIH